MILALVGTLSIIAYTAVAITITFLVVKAIAGLRVTPPRRKAWVWIWRSTVLYPPMPASCRCLAARRPYGCPAELRVAAAAKDEAVRVKDYTTGAADGARMSKVSIITKRSRFESLKAAMDEIGVTGMGYAGAGLRHAEGPPRVLPWRRDGNQPAAKIELEIVVCRIPVRTVIEAAKNAPYTGHIGDSRIFCLRCGAGCEGTHRRGGLRGLAGCGITLILEPGAACADTICA